MPGVGKGLDTVADGTTPAGQPCRWSWDSAYSQGHSLRKNDGLSASFSPEERMDGEKEIRREEKGGKEVKATKKGIGMAKHSSLCFRAPSLRTGKISL